MPNGEHIVQMEPDPTITIVCGKATIPGSPGQYTLQPTLHMHHMPGGWATAFQILMQCLHLTMAELVKEARGQRIIEVATELPDGSSLLRH